MRILNPDNPFPFPYPVPAFSVVQLPARKNTSAQQREVSWPVNDNRAKNFKQEIELVYHLRMQRKSRSWLVKEIEIETIKLVVSSQADVSLIEQ